MYAPIPTTGLGTLGRNGFGGQPPSVYGGMGAAALTPAQQLDASCKAKWFVGKLKVCSPDTGTWDYITSFFDLDAPVSEECTYANLGYSRCLMGQVIAQQPVGAPPAGPVGTGSPADQANEYETADERARRQQQEWLDATTGPPPTPDPDTTGIPWGWIAAGAAAIVLLRRL